MIYGKVVLQKTSHKIHSFFGFTLVELIVVITILAILGTIAFLSFQGYSSSARDSARATDIDTISKGVELYSVAHGNYPLPANIVSTLTGGNTIVNRGTVNISILSQLSANTKDPLTGKEYTYATLNNGRYYQVLTELENPLSFSPPLRDLGIDNAYATDAPVALIKGNYLFDPSLPSLIISSGSSLFDPNNCFVLNAKTNFLSNPSGCTPKKSLTLKVYNSNLVGYWDMETKNPVTQKLLDLSGNGNDLSSSGNTSASGGYFGGAQLFDGSGTITKNGGGWYSTGSINYNSSKNLTVSVLVKTINTCPTTLSPIDSNYAQVIAESSDDFNFNTGSWVIGDWDYSNSAFPTSCQVSASVHINSIPSESSGFYIARGNSTGASNTWKIITIRIININGEQKAELFINGVKQNPAPGTMFKTPITQTFLNYPIYIGRRANGIIGANGLIDDISIYNTALSDDQILEQAKIAGF